MHLKSAVAATIALALLPACADLPPTITAQDGRSWQHQCPAAGTVVQRSSGNPITYTSSAMPGVCRLTTGEAVVLGVEPTRNSALAGNLYTVLAPLFPAAAGRSNAGAVVGQSVRGPDTFMFAIEARVLGFDTVNVLGRQREAVLVEWSIAGTGNNVHRTRHRRWIDTATGALIRSEARVVSGLGEEHSWTATSLMLPASVGGITATPASRSGGTPLKPEGWEATAAAARGRRDGAPAPAQVPPPTPAAAQPARQNDAGRNVEIRLRELQDLRARGVLSQVEYEAARQRILRDL